MKFHIKGEMPKEMISRKSIVSGSEYIRAGK